MEQRGAWASRVGSLLLGLVFAGLLCLNGFFWYRFVVAKDLRESLVDGSCQLVDGSSQSAGWKRGWSFPIFGPSWTDVPCNVDLKVVGGPESKTVLHFTYYQGAVWDYINDRCGRLVPEQAKAGAFDCAYAPDAAHTGGISAAFVGKLEGLPHLPTLLLMKALGLSLCTLGPMLLVSVSAARNAGAREHSVVTGPLLCTESEYYAPLQAA
ncbi:unnamed protein product [Polarella glacialis]|uniref:Uncharacterized protein n=1 Tax=Polarella glacialis TaxID=89957 RepID=A0A813K688_POLGL|nr:unnamed protein product [Polarella glacialis]CAE8695083.1 unnamed protein product [Polarella glacialis]